MESIRLAELEPERRAIDDLLSLAHNFVLLHILSQATLTYCSYE